MLNKNLPVPKTVDDSMSRFETSRNLSLQRNRAFSTEQQPHILNTLSSRQKTLESFDKNETLFDDKIEHEKNMIDSGYEKSNREHMNDTVSRAEYTLGPKKYYIKRVSGEKNNENLKSREYLTDKNSKIKIE